MITSKTITFKNIEFDVEFEYTEAYSGTMFYADGTGEPSEPTTIDTIISIEHAGDDFTEIMEPYVEEIKEMLVEIIND